MTERTPCIVPLCGRTAGEKFMGDAKEYICGAHYRLVDRRVRQLRSTIKRRANKFGWFDTYCRLEQRLWERAKKQAIERAVGISA